MICVIFGLIGISADVEGPVGRQIESLNNFTDEI